jgi:multidrug resistance efflux pump
MKNHPHSPFQAVLLLSAFGAFAAIGGGTAALAEEAAGALGVEVRLVAPAGSEKELKSTLSLPVRALPAAANQPVAKGAMLVEMDVAKLQKELDGLRKDLTRAQSRKRELASSRGATSSSPASNSRADLQSAADVSQAQMEEANAISDLARVQTELATAHLLAPADGYVRRNFYAVGATAKKRKPLATFVEAQHTVLETAVPAAAAAAFTVGATVRVADVADPALGFRGKVLAATPAGESVALRIQPTELPFLGLDATVAATLQLAP